jgi:hypothetical protein
LTIAHMNVYEPFYWTAFRLGCVYSNVALALGLLQSEIADDGKFVPLALAGF